MKREHLLFFSLFVPLFLLGGTMQVQVQTGYVRERPSSLGKVMGALPYGQTVQTLETRGIWTRIQLADKKTGWISTASLSSRPITIRKTSALVGTRASADDLALAGKGFSASTEQEFKRKNPNLRFDAVNQMEKNTVTFQEIRTFIQKGGLKQPGEAK